MLRVVITGAESTGKSTLTKQLADYFKAPFTEEFVRSYTTNLNRPILADDLEPIFKGQLNLEQSACSKEPRLIFHDTNLLSNKIYAQHYFRTLPAGLESEILKQNYSLYLLCDTDIPWVADGNQRDSPEAQLKLQTSFIDQLNASPVATVLISGTQKERLEIAIQAVREKMTNRTL